MYSYEFQAGFADFNRNEMASHPGGMPPLEVVVAPSLGVTTAMTQATPMVVPRWHRRTHTAGGRIYTWTRLLVARHVEETSL